MVFEVSPDNLLQLKEELHERIKNKEHSAHQIYFITAQLIDGKWKDCTMFVDQWPNFNVVVSRPLPEEKVQLLFSRRWHFIYSRDNHSLEEVLSTPGFINWDIVPRFYCLAVALKDVVNAICQKFGGQLAILSTTNEFHFYEDIDNIKIKIPPGFSLNSMESSMSKMAASEWKFSDQEKFGVEEYINHLITVFPSSCLKNEKGDVVSYILTYFFGVMGMLYVKPEHRRHGYGKAVSLDLTKKLQKIGFVGCVTIEHDNDSSFNLYSKINFNKIDENVWAEFSKK